MDNSKLFITISFLFLALLSTAQKIQPFEFKYDTYVAELKTDSTIIKASVYYFTPERKINSTQKYHWFVKNSIRETNANYSGKLLHGEYEEFHFNEQLAIKGQFKDGLKEGMWLFWNQQGDLINQQFWKKGKQLYRGKKRKQTIRNEVTENAIEESSEKVKPKLVKTNKKRKNNRKKESLKIENDPTMQDGYDPYTDSENLNNPDERQ